ADAGRIETVIRGPAQNATGLEPAARVGGRARQPGLRVTAVRERVPVVVHALREVPLALEGGGHARLTFRGRVLPPLELLAPEEEQLLLLLVEHAGDVHGPAERVSVVVPLGLGRGDQGSGADGR